MKLIYVYKCQRGDGFNYAANLFDNGTNAVIALFVNSSDAKIFAYSAAENDDSIVVDIPPSAA